jgi:hypothetical protein
MFVFLGCGKEFVLTGIIPSGFNVNTGVNFFLSWLAGGMVIAPLSTTTTPPTGISSPEGQDALAGSPRVVKDRCGTLESCVVVLHLVKKCEKIRVSLNRQTDRVEDRVQDPILVVLDFHRFGQSLNVVIPMEAVEDVVGGHVGNHVFVETPGLGVAVAIIFEVTKSLEALLE